MYDPFHIREQHVQFECLANDESQTGDRSQNKIFSKKVISFFFEIKIITVLT